MRTDLYCNKCCEEQEFIRGHCSECGSHVTEVVDKDSQPWHPIEIAEALSEAHGARRLESLEDWGSIQMLGGNHRAPEFSTQRSAWN